MPTAMGRSKLGPSFLTSAGARLMVVRPMGNLNPELVSAVETRSRDSFTAASGNPTMTTMVSPQPELTSTSTGKASMPLTAADNTRANMGGYWGNAGARAMRFLHTRWNVGENISGVPIFGNCLFLQKHKKIRQKNGSPPFPSHVTIGNGDRSELQNQGKGFIGG